MSTSEQYKPVSASQVTITELMIPAYSNFGGKIHGGIILSLIDKVAYAAAAKHSGGYCVTLSVDKVTFMQPVEVGQLVSLEASVNYVGRSSLIVGVKVTSENVHTGEIRHTNSCYLTMVCVDEEGKPSPVPGLLVEDPIQARRWYQAWQRKQYDLALREQRSTSVPVTMEAVREAMEGERSRLELGEA